MSNSDLYGGWSHDGDTRASWNKDYDKPECKNCYADLEDDWDFCPCCGKKVEDEDERL